MLTFCWLPIVYHIKPFSWHNVVSYILLRLLVSYIISWILQCFLSQPSANRSNLDCDTCWEESLFYKMKDMAFTIFLTNISQTNLLIILNTIHKF